MECREASSAGPVAQDGRAEHYHSLYGLREVGPSQGGTDQCISYRLTFFLRHMTSVSWWNRLQTVEETH